MEGRNYFGNVNVYCKIKPPSQNEIYGPVENVSENNNKRSKSVTASGNPRKAQPKRSSLASDFHYNFFVCDDSLTRRVIYLPSAVKGKLLDENVTNENDFFRLQDSIFENSRVYELTQTFSANTSINSTYNFTTKPLVYELPQHRSSAVFLYGSTHSGKRYLLRGEETKEQGLVVKALEDIFGLVELSQQSQNSTENIRKGTFSYQVSCCIFCVYEGSSIDLLSERPYRVKGHSNDIMDHYEKLVSPSDFRHLYRRATNSLKELANEMKAPELEDESYLVISLRLKKLSQNGTGEERRTESHLSFVRLANVDYVIDNPQLGESIELLKEFLVSRSDRPQKHTNAMLFEEDALIRNLDRRLNNNPLISFICTLPPSLAYSKVASKLLSMEFAASLFRECMPKRYQRSKSPEDFEATLENRANPYTEGRGFQQSQIKTTRNENRAILVQKTPETRSANNSETRTHQASSKDTSQRILSDEYGLIQEDRIMKNIEKTIHKSIDEVLARQLKSSIAGKQLAVDTRRDQPKPPPKKSISTTKSPGVKKPKVKEEIVIIQELRDRLDRMENKTAQDHRELIRAHDYTRELEHQIEIKEKSIKELENSLRNAQEDIQNAERKHTSIISKEQLEHEKEVEALRRKLDKKDDKYTQESRKLQEEIGNLRDQLEKVKHENALLQSQLQTERTLNSQEGERAKSLESEIRAFRDEFKKKEQYIQALQENLDLQEQTLSDFKRKIVEKNDEIKLLEEDRIALTKRIDNLTRGINYKEDRNEVTFRGLEKEKTVLLDERQQLQTQIREMSHRNQKYEENITELEREIFQLKQDRERLRFSGEELKDTKKDVRKLFEELETMRIKSEQAENERDAKLRELNEQNEILTADLEDLRALCEELRVERDEVNVENTEKAYLLEKLEKQLDAAQTQQLEEITLLESKVRQCTDEVAALRKENTNYRDQERALELKLSESERMRDQYMQKYMQFKTENKNLKANLAEVDWKMRSLIEKGATEPTTKSTAYSPHITTQHRFGREEDSF